MSQILEIHNLLTLSTGHLERRWFEPGAALPTASVALAYGMLLWVPDDIDSLLGCDEDEDDPEAYLDRITNH